MSDNSPHISVNAQYIKDLSFENPSAPQSLTKLNEPPKVNITLDIKVEQLEEEGIYEVLLEISAKTFHGDKTLFNIELVYGGVFTVRNFDEEQKKIILSVHCPALLFPYARKILADASQDGGFQPLMTDPVDFGALYHQKLQKSQEKKDNKN